MEVTRSHVPKVPCPPTPVPGLGTSVFLQQEKPSTSSNVVHLSTGSWCLPPGREPHPTLPPSCSSAGPPSRHRFPSAQMQNIHVHKNTPGTQTPAIHPSSPKNRTMKPHHPLLLTSRSPELAPSGGHVPPTLHQSCSTKSTPLFSPSARVQLRYTQGPQ
jgi:hypothetical protein